MRARHWLLLAGFCLTVLGANAPVPAQQAQAGVGGYYDLQDYSYFEPQLPTDNLPPDPTPLPTPTPVPAPSPTPSPTPSAPSPEPTPPSSGGGGGGGTVPAAPYVPGGPLAFPQGDMAGARADANAFGKAQRSGNAGIATSTDLQSTIPGYTSGPLPQESLADDPDALTSQGASAALANDPWHMVTNPGRTVVTLDPNDLLRAKAIENDPDAYLDGQALGAGQGSCTPLPPAGGGSEYYEASCNAGSMPVEEGRSCSINLVPETTTVTAYKYFSVPDNAYGTPLARYSSIAPYITSGVCKPTGRAMKACAAHTIYGWSANKFCNNYNATEYVCSADLAVASIVSPITGNSWHEQTTTSTVTVSRVDGCGALASDAKCTPDPAGEVCSEPGETRIIDGVAVTQACWAWQRDFKCQSITQASDCSDYQANPQCTYVRDECLDDPQIGACQVATKIYRCPLPSSPSGGAAQYICGDDVYCINGDCEPIEREASTEFKDALVGLHTLGQANSEFNEATMTLFSGSRETCHKKVFGLSNCCSGKGVPLLTPFLCSSAERELDTKDDKGLCHRVGSYCSDKVLGICVTRKDAYCCFESKLSRILQEQGRIQINKPWAAPKTETCKGFTIEEFSRLDLSVMDFSEVYAEFIDAAKLPDELDTTRTIQQRIEQYLQNGGS